MNAENCMLSIIMPCFNHGEYLQDALESIEPEKIEYPFEVIIVDDGSTDTNTLEKLEALKQQGYKVIHQKNGGPAAARNTAIKHATGKYILPLDADNKITPAYVNTGIAILEKGEYQIAYCTPQFFGDIGDGSRIFKAKPFDISEILEANYIDSCSIFLKKVWIKNNGFDEAIPHYGHEDWEFWINAYSNGFNFYFIKDKLFAYRIVNGSVITKFADDKKLAEDHLYMVEKHKALFLNQYVKLSYIKRKYTRDINRLLIAPFLFLGYKLNIIKSPFKKAEEKFKMLR